MLFFFFSTILYLSGNAADKSDWFENLLILLLSCTCGTHHQRLDSLHLSSNSKKLQWFLTHHRYLLDICLSVILRLRVYWIFFQVDSSFSGPGTHITHRRKRSAAWRTVLTHRGWTEPAASTLTILKHATLHKLWCTFTHIVSEDYLSERLSKIKMKECRTDLVETVTGREEQGNRGTEWSHEEVMCRKQRGLQREHEGVWRRGEGGVYTVYGGSPRQSWLSSSLTMTELPFPWQPSLSDGGERGGGMQARTAEMETEIDRKCNDHLLTVLWRCRSSAKVCLTWLQHPSALLPLLLFLVLLSFPRPPMSFWQSCVLLFLLSSSSLPPPPCLLLLLLLLLSSCLFGVCS